MFLFLGEERLEPLGTYTRQTGAGDFSICVRDRKWELGIPICSSGDVALLLRISATHTEDEVGRKTSVTRV